MATSGFETDESGLVSDINVTPLVDVMLVLLVIFMVTAPMLQQGVDVNLPKAVTGNLKGSKEQIVVSVDKEGTVFIGSGNKIPLEKLAEKILAIMKTKAEEDRKVYIKADRELNYGRVMQVMGKLYEGGIYQIGLVSSADDKE